MIFGGCFDNGLRRADVATGYGNDSVYLAGPLYSKSEWP